MARPMGPPGGGRVPEKSKDFKGSMKRLFLNLEKWRYLFIFALVLAMVSAILSLNAPNKLSDFTDVITEGLTPNINENTFNDIMNDPEISYEDKVATGEVLSKFNEDLSNNENLTIAMNRFPILEKLVKKYKFSLQEIERCRKECNQFVFSESEGIWELKEFFRHWTLWLF